jgi:hypothetical protein
VRSDRQFQIDVAQAEVDAAQDALVHALDAAWDDETATERIINAMNRLRTAQLRHAAAESGVAHLPDLVGRG